MRKLHKHTAAFVSILLSFILAFSSICYAADINITLVDTGKNGLKISDNNFFAAFNGIVPGETKRQDLIFTNTYGDSATFYVWSEATEMEPLQKELMQKLSLKLKDGNKELYTCNLTQVIQRKDLCTLKKNQSTVISMYMSMPEDIGSKYAGQTINSKWYVGVDVRPEETSSGGDAGNSDSGGHSGGGGGSTKPIEVIPVIVETQPEETTAVNPTDPYGNEIETSESISGEDTAGLEDETGSEGEAESGKIDIKADVDADAIEGKDIILILIDEDGNRHTVYLYAQNGFEASVLLPAGIYRIEKAYVAGDEDGLLYPLVVSESYITVGSTGISSITISMGERKTEITGEISSSESNTPMEKKQKNAAAVALILGAIALIGGIVFTIFLKRKKDKEDEDD